MQFLKKPILILMLLSFGFFNPVLSSGWGSKGTKVFLCTKDRPNLDKVYEGMTEEQKRFYQRLSFVLFEYGKRILLVDAGNNSDQEEGYITCNWENTGKSIQKGSCKPKGGPRIENRWVFFYHYAIVNDERRTLKGMKMVPIPFNPEFAGIFHGNHSCDLVKTEKSKTK